MSAPIAERVAAGAAWLDENRPGWVERIDLETLDLGDPCRCVLGQEYGNYDDSPLVDRTTEAAEAGFYADDQLYFSWSHEALGRIVDEYDALTTEWRQLITARRVRAS